ncbi:pre-rRNA processing nucleolar protein-like protein Sik1 [Ascodesmis nigricans]|uniref:Nucleolar protein 56 n=1 Tax=Ascodesmis nigricans TaxID=341454 RepID=A0A4S2MY16_9PEZI|nr:pre-rRNA processing nucleolar protein-like protein Sik1 [Ascodesmis nigricans]
MSAVDYLLQESAVGYGLYQVVNQADTIGNRLKEVQEAALDLAKFGKMVKLVSFAPFKGAAEALENANDISEGIVSEQLKALLELNLPKGGKKKRVVLGIVDKNLAQSIKAEFPGVDCETNEVVQDLLRGLRLHGPKLLKQLADGDMDRAQLGLGHAYSRAKVKFSVQKNDNHIIQSIALLDLMDKDINTFAMRVREWYGWHFPELVKIVPDNYKYCKLVLFIKDKKTLSDEALHDLAALVEDDSGVAQSVIDAAKVSMGQDISETDMENITTFAEKVTSLADYRKTLYGYLVDKMAVVAPNLATLIGEVVGARLISHAGSLTNLSKYPASTVQILGAEKALFRALKTKGNTPKYGLIYHSSFIGKAGPKNKGRISRFLANKCSIASRIDSFSDQPTTKFGEVLKKQVEERLEFYATGAAPTKNQDAMKAAMDSVLGDINVDVDEEEAPAKAKEPKKEKKDKKEKKEKKKSKGAEPEPTAETVSKKRSREDDEEVDEEAERKKRKAEKKAAKEAKKAAKEGKKEKKKSKA